ncbi:MAG: ferritin-like domain-containing protein [Actinopolymorphaceae bacterium]
MRVNEREIAALQQALAGIHAAVWGYGVLGPRLGVEEARGRQTYATYRSLRDQVAALIRDRSSVPVAAEAAYALPFEVSGVATAKRLAVHLEDGCAAVFADLVADADLPAVKAFAARLLHECAERRLAWGGEPVAFPGLPEKR